jgi:hypothetical protein
MDGRIRSHDHEEQGVAPASVFLDRLNIHSIDGYDVRRQVEGLVAQHLKPGAWFKVRDEVGDGAFRRLAQKVDLELLARIAGRLPRPRARPLRLLGDGLVSRPPVSSASSMKPGQFSSAGISWRSAYSRPRVGEILKAVSNSSWTGL